jgi:hypothetical protein
MFTFAGFLGESGYRKATIRNARWIAFRIWLRPLDDALGI